MSKNTNQRKIADNIAKVRGRIQQAALENNRDVNSIRLLAVSKNHGSGELRSAFEAGIRDFGENYAQEATNKVKALLDLPIDWHFIGPLQSNKTTLIAEHFAWLHSLDRLRIAEKLSRQRLASQTPLNVCIQINIDHEASKSGIAPDQLANFAAALVKLPHLALRGLMAIPAPVQPVFTQEESVHIKDQLKCSFARMRQLFQALQQQFPQQAIDTLSMGMSTDLELAIAEGSTLVRVGTDIFGERT